MTVISLKVQNYKLLKDFEIEEFCLTKIRTGQFLSNTQTVLLSEGGLHIRLNQ